MEPTTAVVAPEIETCYACYKVVVADDVYCTNCGYPLRGTDFEKNSFLANREAVSIDLGEYNAKIKSAGTSLYYLVGFSFLGALVSFFTKQDDPDVLAYVLPSLILAVLFLALGAYSPKKPLACIISGLALYVIVQVLLMIDDPMNIARGIIFKIIIIGYMIKGIKSALELEKFKKDNNLP